MGLNINNSPKWENYSLGYINYSAADLNAIPGIRERAWERFEQYMLYRTVDQEPGFSKLVDEHFWELS